VKVETRVGLFILTAIGIFFYLSINIRALRLDKDQFNTFRTYFDDTNGLAVKAPVKIAGVEVGWVDKIRLLEDGKAEVGMCVNKNIRLAKNAHAMIHQDGLIGTKNLEIDPGDPSTGFLLPGSVLAMPGRAPSSVGELLDQFRDIATTIQDITSSFKTVFASRRGEENMRLALNSVTQATDRIADFAEVLQRTMNNNEQNLNTIIDDVKGSLAELRITIPSIKDNIAQVTGAVNEGVGKFGEASDTINDAAIQGRETLREAGEVVEKINKGKGLIGKLINEEETYTDIKKTIKGFKDYVQKTQSVMLTMDMHSESMLRREDAKGYFELRLRPSSDYFYLFQLVGDQRGSWLRTTEYLTRRDHEGNIMRAGDLNVPLDSKIWLADRIDRILQTKYDILFGLQFGKRFDRLAFRVGLFESTFGAALDFYVPLPSDKVHWITSIEAWDFRGTKRLTDTRPHIKWLNKVFLMKNIYTAFGIDDIYSKRDSNPFIGAGLRFNDDDFKYFLSSITGVIKR